MKTKYDGEEWKCEINTRKTEIITIEMDSSQSRPSVSILRQISKYKIDNTNISYVQHLYIISNLLRYIRLNTHGNVNNWATGHHLCIGKWNERTFLFFFVFEKVLYDFFLLMNKSVSILSILNNHWNKDC